MSHPEADSVDRPLRIEPRWTDLDAVGHVNNSVFLVYAEEARNRFLRRTVPGAWNIIVVVHNSIDYHCPVEGTDVVDVTCTVEKVGRSSLVTCNVISTTDGRKCATVRTVQVVLAPDREESRPWTDDERAALTKLIG